MKLLLVLLFIFADCGLSTDALANSNGAATFLRKIDRQLCASFKNIKCKHLKRPAPIALKIKKTIKKPLTPVKSDPVPVISEPGPKSTLKPEILHLKGAPPVLPSLKLEAPLTAIPPPVVVIPILPPAPDLIRRSNDPACLAELKTSGADFEPVAQPTGLQTCVVVQPVQLKSVLINGVVVQLPDRPVLNCVFAKQLVSWLQELGGPIATAKEGSVLSAFYTGPGYQCRGRNGDSSAKISEHGFGNAVDIERLKFADGQVFLVHDALDPTSAAFETLKAIRASACTRFTTVLGPGSNAAHREHFHFDLGTHGKTGTYKICE